uniref:Uncharacterized protein n=1 Tax=Aegilops tauschii subsp. strangulata TaxID=200361 RepID=A0A453SC08_AEGTS
GRVLLVLRVGGRRWRDVGLLLLARRRVSCCSARRWVALLVAHDRVAGRASKNSAEQCSVDPLSSDGMNGYKSRTIEDEEDVS